MERVDEQDSHLESDRSHVPISKRIFKYDLLYPLNKVWFNLFSAICWWLFLKRRSQVNSKYQNGSIEEIEGRQYNCYISHLILIIFKIYFFII